MKHNQHLVVWINKLSYGKKIKIITRNLKLKLINQLMIMVLELHFFLMIFQLGHNIHKDIYIFLNNKSGNFLQIPKMQITLKSQNSSDIYVLFPLIQNKLKKLLVVRHNKYVSLFELGENNELNSVGEHIDSQSSDNYETLSDDGKYLVIWNDSTKFTIYNIHERIKFILNFLLSVNQQKNLKIKQEQSHIIYIELSFKLVWLGY
ncbi:unnamed protein product [Paramecium sonneborni]|uniref:Transmembrane protein n=1 Tax=Paramecium sonneborni TaxID=65129 RepID=A0A8S1MDA8_9CILI|nr:unnamed protein product [Paramecium sonneborni]